MEVVAALGAAVAIGKCVVDVCTALKVLLPDLFKVLNCPQKNQEATKDYVDKMESIGEEMAQEKKELDIAAEQLRDETKDFLAKVAVSDEIREALRVFVNNPSMEMADKLKAALDTQIKQVSRE